jgi:hypothetical protein
MVHSKICYFSRKQEGKVRITVLLHQQMQKAITATPGLAPGNYIDYITVSIRLNAERLQLIPKIESLWDLVTELMTVAE